jgi:hypothetical protein
VEPVTSEKNNNTYSVDVHGQHPLMSVKQTDQFAIKPVKTSAIFQRPNRIGRAV